MLLIINTINFMTNLIWHNEQRKVKDLIPWAGNPRLLTPDQEKQLKRSLEKFSLVEIPAVDVDNRLIAGHQRVKVLLILGRSEDLIDVRIPNRKLTEEEFKEYNIRSNHTTGEWDWELLSEFDEAFLKDVGFSSEEMDDIFEVDDTPETFDLEKELAKLNIAQIEIKKGDVWQLGTHRLKCGDSTIEEDVLSLMNGEKADMCLTDPPYILDYLRGKKKNGTPTEGFGLKRDRKYLETDVLPDNFSDLWMANVAKIQKPDFSIMVYENPKNLRTIWNALEKHWKYRNTIIWHLPNRVQNFAAKYKFFNKYDFAMLGTSGEVTLNQEPETDPLLQEEYESCLFATSGKPHWESYEKGKKYCPTDFIDYKASDEKSSGQGIIFGTKPIEILVPYLKVLTKRDDLVIEPFGGSGSTLIAAEKLKRRCFIMEKSPVYAEVIRKRWEKLTGQKAVRIA